MEFVRQTSQSSISSSIYPGMIHPDTTPCFPHLDPGHSIPGFTTDPYLPVTWSSSSHLLSSFPPPYQGQRSSTIGTGLGEDSFTPSAPFPRSTGTRTGWMNHGNSSLQFPFEPSQSREEECTFGPHNIAHTTYGDMSYGERGPTHSSKHVPIPCDVTLLNAPLIAV